jgi:hypothetical protein
MLSADHAAANQKAMDAAKGIGLNPSSGPNAKQKADYDKVSNASGASFDKMFASHMVADHQKDIADYKKEAKAKDAAGEYASAQIDTLQKHLDTAKSLKSRKESSGRWFAPGRLAIAHVARNICSHPEQPFIEKGFSSRSLERVVMASLRCHTPNKEDNDEQSEAIQYGHSSCHNSCSPRFG